MSVEPTLQVDISKSVPLSCIGCLLFSLLSFRRSTASGSYVTIKPGAAKGHDSIGQSKKVFRDVA